MKPVATCQVILLGAQRQRVAKVVSLLPRNNVMHACSLDEQISHVFPLESHQFTFKYTNELTVQVEFLPCVATFGGYFDESSGIEKRYLSSVEYFGPDGKQARGTSLAPFFDAKDDQKNHWGIIGAVVGCGLAEKPKSQDAIELQQFLNLLSASTADFPVHVISCNHEYSTMQEENQAFKETLDKESLMVYGASIGPGKMASFAITQAMHLVESKLLQEKRLHASPNQDSSQDHLIGEATNFNQVEDLNPSRNNSPVHLRHDPDQITFACKRCRTVLFREHELEDPPHSKSAHLFSIRKVRNHGGTHRAGCQSYFLQPDCDLMRQDNSGSYEGKLNCSKCSHKVGQWTWSGAQCSCGTWVTPAIQVPCSKVDMIDPTVLKSGHLPAGAVPYRGQDMVGYQQRIASAQD